MDDRFKIPVYVISLPEAQGRRATMCKRLSDIGLAFSFFDAVDGRGFDVVHHSAYDAFRRRAFFGKDMTGGELGCLLSHRGLYEKMIAENIPEILVFEDDAIIDADLPRVVALLRGQEYDLIRFLGSAKVAGLKQRVVARLGHGYTMNRLYNVPGGAHAYLIRLAGARKMVKAMQRNYMPVDTLMGHVWVTGLKAYVTMPGLAVHDLTEQSFIGDARFDKKQSDVRAFYYPVSRLLFKVYEGVMKRLWP